MPSSTSSPSSRPPPEARTRIRGITLAVLVALGAVAYQLDRWHAEDLRKEEENETAALLAGHGSALQVAMATRAVLLQSLAAWIREQPGAPTEAFRAFAASLHDIDPGIRALQRVENGRIVASYPEAGNEGIIGYDILANADTGEVSALNRALERAEVTVTAPVDLFQGGVGVILRRSAGEVGDRMAPIAALVVDVKTMVDDAQIPSLLGKYRIELKTSHGALVYGDTLTEADAAVEVPVAVPDGSWTLRASPRGGWYAPLTRALTQERLAMGLLLGLAGLLTYALVGRDTRLAAAVASRTAELTTANVQLTASAQELKAREDLLNAALTAGKVLTWEWDVRQDRIMWGGSVGPFAPERVDQTFDVATLLERVHPDDRPGMALAMEEARTSGTLWREHRLDVGGGDHVWMRTEGSCTDRDSHGPVRLVGATADISGVKKLEAEMLHGGRLELIGQLAGGVAHDLNNVLMVIRGELELALDGHGTPPTQADTSLEAAVGRALDAAQYAALLVGQLLTFARKDQVQPTTFEWDAMCGEVATFLARLLGRRIEMELSLNASGSTVHMDRAQAMQILTNLAVNARDAMNESGTLTLSTHTVPDGSLEAENANAVPCVVLEVTDTGAGIPPEAVERIFEPFFTTKGVGRGTGLGLSTTQRIVRDSGGDIAFRTSSEGSTFVVVLPMA